MRGAKDKTLESVYIYNKSKKTLGKGFSFRLVNQKIKLANEDIRFVPAITVRVGI